MKIKDVQNSLIAELGSGTLSGLHIDKLKEAIDASNGRRIGLDFGQVDYVRAEFLDFIKQNVKKGELSFYNVSVDIYVLMFVMQMDKYVDFYMSENDFLKNKQCIVNRRLRLCA